MKGEVYLCSKRACRHAYTPEQQLQVPSKRLAGIKATEGRCPRCLCPTFYLLTTDDIRVLFALGKVIEEGSDNAGTGEFEFLHWSPVLVNQLRGMRDDEIEAHLKHLKRFGLVASKGRGRLAMYWITAKGHQARILSPLYKPEAA